MSKPSTTLSVRSGLISIALLASAQFLTAAEPVRPAPVVPADQVLSTFVVAPGFALELVASEPMVQDPVQIAFDPSGRLWVVEMCGFMPNPEGTQEDLPVGKIVVLEDTNGDGKMDKSTTFLDKLVLPRAITLVDGGAIIAEIPKLWLCRDRNGDLVSDEKVELFGEYDRRGNPEHAANALLRGMDNWIYSANFDKRFRFKDGKLIAEDTFNRGQWGLGQDDYGAIYHNHNQDPLRVDRLPFEQIGRNQNQKIVQSLNYQAYAEKMVWPIRPTPGVNRGYQPDILRNSKSEPGVFGSLREYTAACSPWIYRGDALPGLDGNVFIAEPAANLIRRMTVTSSGYELSAVNAYQQKEFIASTDERFRPVGFANGPDGALYIADMYKGIIQHRIYLTPYLKEQIKSRGLETPNNLGRIYRVVPSGKTLPRVVPPLGKASTLELIRHLGDENGWTRETAQRLVVERADPSAVEALREAVVEPRALGRLHALWTLDGLGVKDAHILGKAFADADPRVRAAALRIAQPIIAKPEGQSLVGPGVALLKDSDANVRLQAAMVMTAVADSQVTAALAQLLARDGSVEILLEAVLSGYADREVATLKVLLADPTWQVSSKPLIAAISAFASCAANAGGKHATEVEALAVAQPAAQAWRAEAIRAGLRAGQALAKAKPTKKKGASAGKQPATLSPEDLAQVAKGKDSYLIYCVGCHQADGRGMEGLAPPLAGSEWVKGSEKNLARIVLHGLSGEVTAAGVTFHGEMPPMGPGLSDEIAADIFTYIRNDWGNGAPPVKAETVKAIRAAEGEHDAWTVEKLKAAP